MSDDATRTFRFSGAEEQLSNIPKPSPMLLALAESCGAKLTGKPDGSESITVVFTIEAWRSFDAALYEQGLSL